MRSSSACCLASNLSFCPESACRPFWICVKGKKPFGCESAGAVFATGAGGAVGIDAGGTGAALVRGDCVGVLPVLGYGAGVGSGTFSARADAVVSKPQISAAQIAFGQRVAPLAAISRSCRQTSRARPVYFR